MLPAYEKIAEEAVKLGKNYTSDDVRAYYRARYDTPFRSVIVADGLTVKYRMQAEESFKLRGLYPTLIPE